MSKAPSEHNIEINGDVNGSAVVNGNGNTITINPSPNSGPTHRHPSQEKLLIALETEIQQRMKQSLPNAVRIAFGLERQDYLVKKLWSTSSAQECNQVESSSISEAQLLEVFTLPELSQQLLILGEPGSGKTIMLLELAQSLLQRAKTDESEPVPVLIDLSSWKDIEQPIFDWLLQELKEKYRISQDLAQRWIEANQLLPLLDGFDEVAPQFQEACACALNNWLIGPLEQRPIGVVICSRQEEYCQLEKQLLNLCGAVYLTPWTDSQIRTYLLQLGLDEIWRDVNQDEALKNLLTKPLFLSMFALAQKQEKFLFSDWYSYSTADLRIEYLLDIYWEAAITRELVVDPQDKRKGKKSKTYGEKRIPTALTVKRALIFAAKGLESESRTELLIEGLQPSWLQEPIEKAFYSLLFCFLMAVPLRILLEVIQPSSAIYSPELMLLLLTFPWLRLWITRNDIVSSKRLRFSKLADLISDYHPIISLILSLMSTSIFGLSWLIDSIGTEWRLPVVVPITGVMINMSIVWLLQNIREEVTLPTEANQGMKNLWKNIPLFSLFLLPIALLIFIRLSLSIDALSDYSFSIRVVFIYVIYILGFAAFESGGKSILQHIALRFVCLVKRYVPFRYDLLLNYCTERLLLQRLGGRYRFMHRFLQEYFAKMPLP